MTTSSHQVVVVGTGFGCRVHVPALRAAGFHVAALVGADAERTSRRAAANGVPLAYTDLKTAIEETKAVAVTIATPPDSHCALTLTALAAGCHVICEKPLAMDVDQARTMLRAAQASGVVHLAGHEFRWLPERALIARGIAEGLIGEPRFLTLAQYIGLVADPGARMPDWWFDRAAGGGWLGASGSHIVDQVRTWGGEFESVSAALPSLSARETAVEDSYVVRFRLRSGLEGVIQQTAGAWGPATSMSRVAGSEGALWVENGAVWLADRNGKRELPTPEDLQLPSPAQLEGAAKRPPQFELAPYTALCEEFRALIEGRQPSRVAAPTFADGVACMEVLDAIRASAAAGGELVRLPCERNSNPG